MRERLTSLNGNHNLYFSVTFFTRLINQGGRQTTERLCEEVYAAGTKNYYVLTFFTCGLLASIRWSKSCVLIDFPSGQEGSLYVLWFNFILGLKFIFLCFKQIIIIHYHTQKTKEDKIEPQHTPTCIYVVMKKANKNRQIGINYSVGMQKTFWYFVTWDQALFSFRFENYIPAGKAKRKER